MVLKSLILQGFKSFPAHTEIRFAGGVTAIVGPNGSGKSNIADAIRWVLGEQSTRSLRGTKMEDVIFGGTAKRGPVGFAEVSLVLDNADGRFRSEFTEVMITRRYYRSGESEYYINRRHCRLRDIHELFMDTGLGREGYSIIGQGRIDEILSLKSEDRREVFEEAAGITKFRYRKEEAERRLHATEENLVRIRDLFEELTRQLEPLEQQSEKARAYLALRDRLRVLELSLWPRDLDRLREEGSGLAENLRICSEQLTEAANARTALYARSEQLAADLRQIEIETEALRRSLRETEARAADRTSRSAVLAANIQNNEENIDRTRREMDRRREQAASLDEQTAARQARIDLLESEHQGLAARLAEEEAEQNRLAAEAAGAGETLAALTAREKALTEERFALELARTAAQTALDGMDARHETIDADVAACAARLEKAETDRKTAEQALADCLEALDSAKNKLAGVSIKVQSRRSRVESLTEEARQAAAALTDCDNRIGMLREMQRDYEGFSRAVKTVMNAAGRGLRGVHGPVSSLIRTEEQFLTAIDTALGAAASNIVVDSSADGKRAIELLKRQDGGRATFLPLDTIRLHELRESGLDTQPRCYGTADVLISCDAPYRQIVQNLLARTVIAENLDCALRIAKAYNHRFRIVTLDGQMIQAGGAMTGGSVSKGTGALARAAKLQALEEQRGAIEHTQKNAEQALHHAKHELNALDAALEAAQTARAQAQEREARLRAELAGAETLAASVRAQYDGLVQERDHLSEAKAGHQAVIGEKTAALAAAAQALTALGADLAAAVQAQETGAARQSENAAARNLTQTKLAENRTEAAAENRALADLIALREDMDSGLRGAEEQIEAFRAEIARLTAERAQIDVRKDEDSAVADGLRNRIAGKAEQRMRIEAEKTTADKKAQVKNDEILNLEREHARLESRTAQAQDEEKRILDQMWERYELTPTPAAELAVPLENEQAAAQQAAALRGEMKALGHINLDAVEEYEKIRERHAFLGEQKSDLEKAQTELYKVIDQLTVQMKEVFASEFAKLNALFGQTFREIFGGGHAELQLADTSDILRCGIDIRVSPPGKAVKTITLLSGGEKAFVAIALHFAILKLRPTPFCVLDEIEAALDDVNVGRFAKYIRRLAGETQFIIITHRRGTMEEADMLYGVTMQEQGVSRLLMLNLAEAEKQLGKELK